MITLGLRNLFRHRRRTLIALAMIGFGVIALLLVGGFMEWATWGMREGTIQSRLGHIQMTRPGYFKEGSADPFVYLLPDQLGQQVDFESIPEVEVVSSRLVFSGLASHGDVTIGFIGEGVDPDKEKILSKYLTITAGDRLSADKPNGILLGAGLAANLGVSTGDQVVLLANTGSGGLNGVEGFVEGVFQSASKEFDDAALRIPLDTAKSLLRVSGAHTWIILLNNTEQTEHVLELLQALYPETQSHLQFTPWHELADFFNKTVKLFTRQMKIIRLIVALIIILSISNTMVMSVLERTGEIGTLMAMGFRRRKILQLFVGEGLLLGVAGGLLGVIVGTILAIIISTIGIPMPPPPGMDVGYTAEIQVTWSLTAGVMALAVLTTLLGSLYPAWKASRLEIVDALRHNH